MSSRTGSMPVAIELVEHQGGRPARKEYADAYMDMDGEILQSSFVVDPDDTLKEGYYRGTIQIRAEPDKTSTTRISAS